MEVPTPAVRRAKKNIIAQEQVWTKVIFEDFKGSLSA